jgi:hypothetical protein
VTLKIIEFADVVLIHFWIVCNGWQILSHSGFAKVKGGFVSRRFAVGLIRLLEKS